MPADDEKEKSTTTTATEGENTSATRADKASPSAAKSSSAKKARALEEDDEDFDDDDDDLDGEDFDDEDDEEEPPPPPKKTATKKSKSAPVSKRAPAAASAKAKRPVKKKGPVVPRKPARFYVPFVVLGMLIIGAHVFWDVALAPVAVFGISVVVWAFMGIGSANEVPSLGLSRTSPARPVGLALAGSFCSSMRIAFFGLPLAALLLEKDGHELSMVCLSRLDAVGLRRARRHFAGRLIERPRVDDPALLERLRAAKPDLLVSWFWTTRIPLSLVRACPLGAFGVHPSLLPRHRGPDPYFWAIDSGDETTGVTAHRIAEDYDTGAVLAQRAIAIDPSWNAWTLARKLDRPSLSLLREVTRAFAEGRAPAEQAQDERLATLAPPPDDDVCELRFSQTTAQVLRRIRALAPAPGAFTEIGDAVVTIIAAETATRYPAALIAGEAAVVDGHAVVRTADGAVVLLRGEIEEQPADAADLAALVERARELSVDEEDDID